MHDRTTKLLLFAIALALWGLLIRPTFAPNPALAQSTDTGIQSAGRMILTADALYVYHEDGNVYRFDRNLNLQLRALRQFDNVSRATFATLGPK